MNADILVEMDDGSELIARNECLTWVASPLSVGISARIKLGASSRLDVIGMGVIECSLIVEWITNLSSRARCEDGDLCFALLVTGRARWLDISQLLIRIGDGDVGDSSSCIVCLCVYGCVLLVALELEKGDFDCERLKARP